jgi:hypothetical protein
MTGTAGQIFEVRFWPLFGRGQDVRPEAAMRTKRTFANASGLGVHALTFHKSLARESRRPAALRVRN